MLWEEVGKDQGRGGVPGSGEGGAEETWKGLHLLPTVSSRFYQILILITSAIFKKKKNNEYTLIQYPMCVFSFSSAVKTGLPVIQPHKKPSTQWAQTPAFQEALRQGVLPVLVARSQTQWRLLFLSLACHGLAGHHCVLFWGARCEIRGGGIHWFLDHGDVHLIVLSFGLFLSQAVQPNKKQTQESISFFSLKFQNQCYAVVWCKVVHTWISIVCVITLPETESHAIDISSVQTLHTS